VELPAGYFDVVTAIDVLYYFREPHQEFRVLRRAIKQDGLLVCCIPFGDTQLLRNATAAGRLLFRGSRSLLSSGHVFFYSARSIRLLLQATGFRVLAIHALPGNRQSRAYQNLLYTGYFAASRFLSWVSFGRLTLSPNYLIIAMPSATEE
jgi:predicted TPR repeat methyltransferase